MLPYSRGIILDNASNYGIVKTEAVFGFGPPNHDNFMNDGFNSTDPVEWIFTPREFQRRSLEVEDESRALKPKKIQKSTKPKKRSQTTKAVTPKKYQPKKIKMKKRKSKGVKKCIFKILKQGEGQGKKRKRNRNRFSKMSKKYMMPLILGLLAAKSVLIPVALKALAFLSAKGLMMGFFSTVMASLISLKGMFDHSHSYQNRKDDAKTQVEIIQVPTKSEDHVFYDDHYRRGDVGPMMIK